MLRGFATGNVGRQPGTVSTRRIWQSPVAGAVVFAGTIGSAEQERADAVGDVQC